MNRFPAASQSVRHRIHVRMVSVCAILVTSLSLGLAPLSSADTAADKERLDADIEAMRVALEGTSEELARAFVELQRTKAELPEARKELASAEAARQLADRDNQTMATALAIAEANSARAKEALRQNAQDRQTVQDQLGNVIRDEYQRGGVSGLSVALEATSPQDFTDRLVMMDTVMRVRRETLRGLATMRAQGQAAQAHLAAVQQQVAALKVQAQAALAQTTATRRKAVAAKAKLDRLYSAQARHEARVSARKAAETANLAKMQAESDSLTRLLAARAAAARAAAIRAAAIRAAAVRAAAVRAAAVRAAAIRAAENRAAVAAARAAEARAAAAAARSAEARAVSARAANARVAEARAANARVAEARAAEARAAEARAAEARSSTRPPAPQPAPESIPGGFLSHPVSAPVSSEFGMRLNPVLLVRRLHAGIDFAASCGSPVYAAAAGEVILSTLGSASSGYGNRLVIAHGFHRGVDLTTTYNHLTSFVVTSGQVARGQLVAYAGTTGTSTGCHLHFETREDGTAVNPRLWL